MKPPKGQIEIRARIHADSELAERIALYAKQLPIRTSHSRLMCHLIELGLKSALASKTA